MTKRPDLKERAAKANPRSAQPAESKLPLYELTMERADWLKMERAPRSNETYPGTFRAQGREYQGVRVRFRGDWARSWPKKPLKIFFADDTLFEGRDRLNLNPGWRDPAFVREPLAYHIYAVSGVPVPACRMVCLHLNGHFHGLYVEVEQPEKSFLRRVNLKGAAVFKAASRPNYSDERDLGNEASYRQHYEKQTRKSEGLGELQQFCHDLARTTNVLEFFTRHVDLDRYVNYLAATVLVQNWDCYNKNHSLLYDQRGSRQWLVVPWDLDRTLGDHWRRHFGETRLPVFHGTRQSPGPTGWNRMFDRFMSEPALRARLLDRLAVLLDTEFTPRKLFPWIDQLASDIEPEAALDRRRWPGVDGNLAAGIADLKSYIERRRGYLLGEMAKLRKAETFSQSKMAASQP